LPAKESHMKTILIYLKHFLIVTCVIIAIGFVGIVSQHGHIGFGTDDLAYKVGGEGPHIFANEDKLEALYIRGGREEGFYTEKLNLTMQKDTNLPVYLAFDDSTFNVQVSNNISIPESTYDDGENIIAISDLEGNYRAFRDFLIANNVIDKDLNWTFNKGHLVLVGDMVDRGYSTTQLLWLIYKLEQDAKSQGGLVHFIVGNHEIKNMQGNFRSAAPKYLPVAGILGKQQYDLFGPRAFLGQWLQSKNVIERINGHLFVHGGLHPGIQEQGLNIDDVNRIVRQHYRQFYFPNAAHSESVTLLTSNKTGPAWYRGYFKDDLEQTRVDSTLKYLEAKAVIVGHTIQFKVRELFNRKVFAIDVKHPNDYSASFPIKRSEGLLISKGEYYRLLDNGEKIQI